MYIYSCMYPLVMRETLVINSHIHYQRHMYTSTHSTQDVDSGGFRKGGSATAWCVKCA